MRKAIRSGFLAFAVGGLCVGLAWAGAGLIPINTKEPPGASNSRKANVSSETVAAAESVQSLAQVPQGDQLPPGEFLVGADKTSLTPAPDAFQPDGAPRTDPSQPTATWEKDPAQCNTPRTQPPNIDPNEPHAGLFPDSTLGWPGHNPNCIYLGGYGIGPFRAAEGVSDHDVWVRSVAISNNANTVIFQIIDMVGFFNKYRSDVCDGCGIMDMRREIAKRVGLENEQGEPQSRFVSIGSTHTHGGADGYGGWGGLPKWYWHQIRDAVITSAERAVANILPARISVGAIDAREFGGERRDHYYSTHDYLAVWMQATTPGGTITVFPDDPKCAIPGQQKKPECQPTEQTVPPSPIATLINYAAHPTVLGSGNRLLHPDWPGSLNRGLERTFGGTALTFEGGLGNASDSGSLENYENEFNALLASDITRAGTPLGANEIEARSVDDLEHPVTNWGELGLAAIGLFDRDFTPGGEAAGGPGAYEWHKQTGGPEDDVPGRTRSCVTSGPTTVRTTVAAYKIGGLNIFTGPGELFSNMTEVVKSVANKGVQTMVFGQTNDSLGYILQSFEFDRTTNAATELGTNTAEYEEIFALDVCFGDHVLDAMLNLASELGIRR